MTNQEKGDLYHSLLLKHDKLDGKIADIKSEAAGMELNDQQKTNLKKFELEKERLVVEAKKLFNI
jgi:hypothetical protein|tara:strand:+ start:25 stop:219 length:195 start_codon:yes stop_codon:yes gene_type:complete